MNYIQICLCDDALDSNPHKYTWWADGFLLLRSDAFNFLLRYLISHFIPCRFPSLQQRKWCKIKKKSFVKHKPQEMTEYHTCKNKLLGSLISLRDIYKCLFFNTLILPSVVKKKSSILSWVLQITPRVWMCRS